MKQCHLHLCRDVHTVVPLGYSGDSEATSEAHVHVAKLKYFIIEVNIAYVHIHVCMHHLYIHTCICIY